MTTATQFFARSANSAFLLFGVLQGIVYSVAVLFAGSFWVVMLKYAPVMLFLLVMSVLGLKNGSGSWQLIVGIVILFVASGIQAAAIDAFTPLDRNGLHHLVSMAGVCLMYFGERQLRTQRFRPS